MTTTSPADLTKENAALTQQLADLKRRKKYGLVWEDKAEAVVTQCQTELPVLREVAEMGITCSPAVIAGPTRNLAVTNLLIEGDNYHALSVLNYTHAGRVGVIYIDPPYNTGARDWKYNNDYVDAQDGYRHSKWLSMMHNRLRLAKNLLTDEGIICVAIDHNELFALGCLMDELFGGDNRLGVITVVMKEGGRNLSSFFGVTNEYYLIYARNKEYAKFNIVAIDDKFLKEFDLTDDNGRYKLREFIRDFDPDATRELKPKFWYPIYISHDLQQISLEKQTDWHEIWPVSTTNREMTWNTLPKTFMQNVNSNNVVVKNEKDRIEIFRKVREYQVFKTHWVGKKYDAIANGTTILKKLLGRRKFDYPKSLYAVLDFLKITTKKDSIILDFFAGSGTTGHAVSLLNKQDGGRRQFILCTNNENGIAREVCQPRIKAVIEGHEKLPDITGIPSNLKYYQTDFVAAKATDQNKIRLTRKATEMLCIKENTFEVVEVNENYQLFKNGNNYTGVLLDSIRIEQFVNTANKLSGKFAVYVFSFGEVDFTDEFADMKNPVVVKPIPATLLNVYKRLFR